MNEFRLQTDTVSSGVRLGTTGSAASVALGPFGPAWSELIRIRICICGRWAYCVQIKYYYFDHGFFF